MGDELDPDEVSRLLGCEPSLAYREGDEHRFKTGSTIRKCGMWSLNAEDREPADLDAQITEIFDRVSDDPTIWAELSAAYTIDIFCGFFMKGTDEGLDVSPATMKILGDRGIRLGFCIYAPLPNEESEIQPESGGHP